jgi:hypothetical protein
VPAPHKRALMRDDLVRRYLRAYGPASVLDMQAWSGISRLGEVFAKLGDKLVTFTGEDGRVLYDLPDAPRPSPDTPAPVRFLPDYDNVILGFANRDRILSADNQKRLVAASRSFRAVLVDGFVAGSWSIVRKKDRATLTVTPFRKLLKREMREVETEGAAFLAFMEEDAADRDVSVSPVRAG